MKQHSFLSVSAPASSNLARTRRIHETKTSPTLREKVDDAISPWFFFSMFGALVWLFDFLVVTGSVSFEAWRGLFFAGAGVFVVVGALISFMTAVNKPSEAESDAKGWSLRRIVWMPLSATLCLWVFFSATGWFATTPSWATVMIVLLVLIVQVGLRRSASAGARDQPRSPSNPFTTSAPTDCSP